MTFQHHYGWALPLTIMGMGPRHSKIEVGDGVLIVTMGWAFRLRAPLATVASARHEPKPIPWTFGIGVHVWARQWAVNASRRNHVIIDFESPQRAWLLGFPIRVRVLHLSPEEPERLVRSVTAPASLSG